MQRQVDKFFLHHLQISVDRRQLGYDRISQLVIARHSANHTKKTCPEMIHGVS